MAIYFFFFIWILLFVVNPKLQNNRQMRNVMFIFLGFFLCTCYMAGIDWVNYEPAYEQVAVSGLNSDIDASVEVGYLLLTFVFSKLGINFWYFFMGTKMICFYSIIRFILKYTKGNFAWALLFFYSYLSLLYFIACPFRNLIAATIFLHATEAMLQKRWLRFGVISALAASIHISVLLYIPFVFLLGFRKRPIKPLLSLVAIVGVYSSFFFLIRVDLLTKMQIIMAAIFGDMKNLDYLIQQGRTFSIGMLAIVAFYLYIIFKIDINMFGPKEIKLYNLSILYVLFYIVGYFIPIAGRFCLFGFMPFICTLSLCMHQLSNKKSYVNVLASMIFVLFLGNAIKNTVTNDYRYVPYSSYLQYVFQDKPSYNERSNYNIQHSPYKNNESATYELRE